MKHLLIVTFFAIALSNDALPQPTETTNNSPSKGILNFCAGINIGIFNPSDVNNHLNNYWDYKKENLIVESEFGFPEVYTNYVGILGLNYYVTERFSVMTLSEFGWSPKVLIFDDTKWFHYTRISPGALLLYHLPLKINNELNVGVGAFYHIMRFDVFNANTLGYQARGEFLLTEGAVNIGIMAAFDIATGNTGKRDNYYGNNPSGNMQLSYTGFRFGTVFYF
jgi:hypothetical protein